MIFFICVPLLNYSRIYLFNIKNRKIYIITNIHKIKETKIENKIKNVDIVVLLQLM